MSICAEAQAFLGVPRVTVPATLSVRLLTGNEPREELAADIPKFTTPAQPANEDTMPKTSSTEKPKRKYTRRQPVAIGADLRDLAYPESETAGKTRKPRQEKLSGVVFSVDSTGALLIRRGDHGMEFSAVEVDELMAFMEKSRILWAPD